MDIAVIPMDTDRYYNACLRCFCQAQSRRSRLAIPKSIEANRWFDRSEAISGVVMSPLLAAACAGVNLGSMRRIVLHAKDFSWDGSWSSAPWPELRLGISMLARGEEVTTIALCAGSIGPSHGFWLRAADLTHNFWREGKSGD
jgi:hypothetical protein